MYRVKPGNAEHSQSLARFWTVSAIMPMGVGTNFETLSCTLRYVHQNNIYECVLIAGCIHLHIIGIPDIMIARYVYIRIMLL